MDVVQIPKPLDNLPPEQKELREEFIKRYIVEYDAVAAVKQMGYHRDWVHQIVEQFMSCPYVARRVRELEDEMDGDEDIEKRRLFAALRREASYHGHGASHSARVAALTKLASLRGMDRPVKMEHDVTNRGGVMQVPGIADVTAWEEAALGSQEALQKGTQST
jgi:hypothetical protein